MKKSIALLTTKMAILFSVIISYSRGRTPGIMLTEVTVISAKVVAGEVMTVEKKKESGDIGLF